LIKVLAVGAHPGDVEIFCLGALLEMAAIGYSVGWAVATDGSRGAASSDGLSLVSIREKEAKSADKMFGVEPIFLNFKDGSLSSERGLVSAVEGLL